MYKEFLSGTKKKVRYLLTGTVGFTVEVFCSSAVSRAIWGSGPGAQFANATKFAIFSYSV